MKDEHLVASSVVNLAALKVSRLVVSLDLNLVDLMELLLVVKLGRQKAGQLVVRREFLKVVKWGGQKAARKVC